MSAILDSKLGIETPGATSATITWSNLTVGTRYRFQFFADSTGSLPTGIEWVVGGDPTNGGGDAALAPTIQASAETGFHTVTYRLSNQAAADSGTDAFIEYPTGLGTWTKAVHNGDTVRVTSTPGLAFATVEVKLKDTLAPNGRLFAHLKATIGP